MQQRTKLTDLDIIILLYNLFVIGTRGRRTKILNLFGNTAGYHDLVTCNGNWRLKRMVVAEAVEATVFGIDPNNSS